MDWRIPIGEQEAPVIPHDKTGLWWTAASDGSVVVLAAGDAELGQRLLYSEDLFSIFLVHCYINRLLVYFCTITSVFASWVPFVNVT